MKLRIVYLLEDTALFGGVKVVLQQANLLARRGHKVTVVSKGAAPHWYELEAGFRKVEDFSAQNLPVADVTVATFWTTLGPAMASGTGSVTHLCQGFEGDLTHNREEHPAILDAYRCPVPALVVAPHLGRLLEERFGRPSRLVRQSLEGFWQTEGPFREMPAPTPRVLVTAPFEFYVKGVDVALAAVVEMRKQGLACSLIRLSQWPVCAEESALAVADEYHQSLLPRQVAELMRCSDLLLAPSWPQEGFGLPVLEAMACGLPAVVSDIPAFRGFAADAACLVKFDSPVAFATAAREILENPSRWRQMRARGLEVAARYSPQAAADQLEEALRWVVAGAWRRELRGAG